MCSSQLIEISKIKYGLFLILAVECLGKKIYKTKAKTYRYITPIWIKSQEILHKWLFVMKRFDQITKHENVVQGELFRYDKTILGFLIMYLIKSDLWVDSLYVPRNLWDRESNYKDIGVLGRWIHWELVIDYSLLLQWNWPTI